MTNAKTEFEDFVKGLKIKCASITLDPWDESSSINLKVNHTEEEYLQVLEELDFEYYSGYGTQEVYGTIWFENGTWADREEYDGAEWWELKYSPEIPKELRT